MDEQVPGCEVHVLAYTGEVFREQDGNAVVLQDAGDLRREGGEGVPIELAKFFCKQRNEIAGFYVYTLSRKNV